MYGLILSVFRDLLLKQHGEDQWIEVCRQAKTISSFEEEEPYPDAWLYQLATAASEASTSTTRYNSRFLLDISVPELLEALGYYLIEYILKTDYSKLLNLAGKTLPEVLNNINRMHGHLKASPLHQMSPPTFRCTQEKPNRLRLHYIPGVASRVALAPLVIGIVKGLAERYLNLDHLTVKQKRFKEKGDDHDEFVVRWKTPSLSKDAALNSGSDKSVSSENSFPLVHGLSPSSLDEAFPFHIVFNKKLEIVQMGKSLAKLIPAEKGDSLSSFFTLDRPSTASFSSWSSLCKHCKTQYFQLLHKYDHSKDFILKGQMLWNEKEDVMCFVGSPLLERIEDASYFGLSMSDFALHDNSTSILLMHSTSPSGTEDRISFEEPLSPRSEDYERKRNVLKTWFDSKLSSNETTETTTKKKKRSSRRSKRLSHVLHSIQSHVSSNEKNEVGGGSTICFSSKGRSRSASPSFDVSMDELSLSSSTSSPNSPSSSSTSSSSSSAPSSARSPSPSSSASHRIYNAFYQLLIEDGWSGYPLMKALLTHIMKTPSTQVDRVFDAAVSLHKRSGNLMSFLEALLMQDIGRSTKETLLRSDGPSIKVLHAFVEQEAQSYITKLAESMKECIEGNKKSNLHIDTERLTDKNMSEHNARILLAVAERWLRILCTSVNHCPPPLRRLLKRISEEVAFKYPDLSISAVANVLFFRFIGPVLLTPKIGEERDLKSQRALTVVFKVVQSLVNMVEFPESEDNAMKLFNTFLSTENHMYLRNFVIALIDESKIVAAETQCYDDVIATPRGEATEEWMRSSISVIKDAFLQNMEFLWATFTSDPQLGTLLQRFIATSLNSIRC
ncbi:Heme NO-binding protein [Balamuthia mandrillaris]